jgi:hypothetical protein
MKITLAVAAAAAVLTTGPLATPCQGPRRRDGPRTMFRSGGTATTTIEGDDGRMIRRKERRCD